LAGGGVACRVDHRGRSTSCVSGAVNIEYQGSSGNGRVRIRVVENQRCSTNASIEAAGKVLRERKPTESRVCIAGYDVDKGVGAVRRVERAAYRSRIWCSLLRSAQMQATPGQAG